MKNTKVVALEVERIKQFDLSRNIASRAPRWKHWKRAFSFYMTSKDITSEAQKKALLLHMAGMDIQDLFDTLTAPAAGGESSEYKTTLKALDDYFTPKVNVPYERHIFHQMKQEESATIDQFIALLTRQSVNCDFGGEVKEHTRDQVIDKCPSSQLRRKLLTKGQS